MDMGLLLKKMMTKYHIFYVKTIGFSAPFEKVFKRKLESFNPFFFIFNLEQEHTVFQIISKNWQTKAQLVITNYLVWNETIQIPEMGIRITYKAYLTRQSSIQS